MRHSFGFSLSRRAIVCAAVIGLALGTRTVSLAAEKKRPLKIGMTPAFLHDQHGMLNQWRSYLENKLARRVQFVQRDSYQETMDLIRQGQLDFAWICDYPLIVLRDKVRIVAVPLNGGRPMYQSYVIVHADDVHTASLRQLRGRVFAYADPHSNTGYLAPRYHLREQGENLDGFFAASFFTYSHRKVVDAVAVGLASAGAVDSYVWETLAQLRPEVVRQTRIVWRSPEYAFPPFVATSTASKDEEAEFRAVLLGMARDPEGRQLLSRLNLDGFTRGDLAMYADVARMMKVFGER